jgi:RecA-family ATPase
MSKIELIKAKDIQAMEIEPLTWIVKDLIPEGLSLLAGRPKIGKSWFALNIAVAVAEGSIALNKFETSQSKVLYIPYEDNTRRIKSRLNNMLNGNEAHENLFFPKDLYFPKLNQEGLDCIRQCVENEDGIKLIIIDTFGSAVNKGNNNYCFQDDYNFMMGLQQIALKYHIAILLIHHTRKMIAESVYDDIIGTTGITASPDTLMIIKKHLEGCILHITGRDVEEADYKSVFDAETFFWNVTDDKVLFGSTVERQAIIDLFESDYDKELSVKEIAEKTGKSREAISQIIRKMLIAGEIMKGSKTGYYRLPRLN